jgi:ELP3 family radical SAM enzyme/protein acetyltransferase
MDYSNENTCNASNIEDIETLVNKKFESCDDNIAIYEAYVNDIIKSNFSNKKGLEKYIRVLNRKYHINASCMKLLYVYRNMCKSGKCTFDIKYEELFQSKGFRSQSGVLVVAVFTAPYPEYEKDGEKIKQEFSCEFDCYYCPKEPNQPRSYLLEEPGVRRANANKFDPRDQFKSRINAYINMGHPIDKIELLVLGGTISSYPRDYVVWFINQIFYAANTLYSPRGILSLEEEKKINETAECRIIGITLETRPDKINQRELKFFRELGVTRVQMGVQHTDDRILYRINRRCNSNHAIKAIKMLKDSCFKVDIHLMPDLPKPLKEGISNTKETFMLEDIDEDFDMLEADREMFDTVINSPDWQADQWKIYPCEVVPWTRIEIDYKNGSYKPYGNQDHPSDWTPLSELLVETLGKVKPWVRLNRVIRDIPNMYIIGGNQNVSMRQDIDNVMNKRNIYCMDIRNREVKKRDIDPSQAVLKIRQYEASEGMEYFISFETEDEKILFGFLRLRLSYNSGYELHDGDYIFPELANCALIRELHIYGQVKKVHEKKLDSDLFNTAQHMGFGTLLVNKAIEISRENGYNKIAVISGVGVKNYYRKFGFEDEQYFMTLDITHKQVIQQNNPNNTNYYIYALVISLIAIILYFFIQ